ncbi:transposase (fragment) [Limnospira indica PCC 8005]|uniref:Transposase n=1 Tax=Limnospira indica PCC 8005 TaxID=376219 RepID=A0A9P1KIQ7_9CYAN
MVFLVISSSPLYVLSVLSCAIIPTLKPGQTLVLDNATFHKGGRIAELVEAAQCRLLYLPPYSPDLNKIEKCWS